MTGERYEAVLDDLYARLLTVYAEHDQHVMPGTDGRGLCEHCGEYMIPGRAPETCPVSTLCDDLGGIVYDLERDVLERLTEEEWLTDLGPGLLDWGFDVLPDNTPRQAIMAAVGRDAQERLFPNYATMPVDPATTRPARAHRTTEPVPITKQQALAAVVADGRVLVHLVFRVGGVGFGCDVDTASLIAAIETADDSDPDHPQIGWVQDPFGHELLVIDGDNNVRWYDVAAPEGTFGSSGHSEGDA